jgi:hypothetical protein
VIHECSELLRQDCESQWDEDRSCRTKGASVWILLDSPGELFLRLEDASRAKVLRDKISLAQNRVKFHCRHQSWLGAFRLICPTVHVQPEASPELVQIPTALTHRDLRTVDEEHMESTKNLAVSSIKKFSHSRGKEEIRQNAEAQFWNGLGSEFAVDI